MLDTLFKKTQGAHSIADHFYRSAPAVMKRSEASINSQYRQLLQLPQHHPHMKAFLFLTQDIPEDVITEYLRDGDIVYQE